ncbi:MAG: hypothetical protein KDK48_00630, partial [Chlamydiia bacterium]|nr:hypothetical protein [Chlamydiia bacterium]
YKLVVKPNRMNYGLGIFFVEPNDVASYERAIVEAFKHGQEVVVEEFCEGEEYRFLVINGKCEAVCKRIPANVVGDGSSSIKQLIQLKNHDPKKYKIPRYRLKLGKEEKRFLAGQGLDGDFVPEKGQRIWLRTNSNVSTGGDCIDFTDVAHIDYQTIAVRAAEAMDAVFCGIDMLIPEISLPADKGGYAVIECNFNPALWIHRYPTEGTKRYVERATLDVLGFPAS